MTICCTGSGMARGYRSASICINKPAIMRPRIARLSISICSSSVWNLSPATPRPSKVGTPIAPVKLPSLPPPELSCRKGWPKSLARDFAMATSFNVAGDASQTGLVKPNVTVVDTSAAESFSANIFSTPASRSVCFLPSTKPRPLPPMTHSLPTGLRWSPQPKMYNRPGSWPRLR